jgi:DNA-damage-inducible protein J
MRRAGLFDKMEGSSMATSNVTILMDSDLKSQADEVFGEMGMSFTTAVNIFTRQVARERRIPFEISAGPAENPVDEAALRAAVDFANKYPDDFARMTT